MSNEAPIPKPKAEQFNQVVRGAVTLILVIGFVLGFLVFKIIDSQVFSQIVGMVVAFWFAARERESPPPPLRVPALSDRGAGTPATWSR